MPTPPVSGRKARVLQTLRSLPPLLPLLLRPLRQGERILVALRRSSLKNPFLGACYHLPAFAAFHCCEAAQNVKADRDKNSTPIHGLSCTSAMNATKPYNEPSTAFVMGFRKGM